MIYMREKKKNCKNWAPLHYAAQNNSKEIGELLISKGADIEGNAIINQVLILVFLINFIDNR